MKLFKEHELQELGIFYLVNFIIGMFAVAMPYAVIYFLNTGLTFLQISIMFAVFGTTTFLLEIPTGAFADEYSRKWSVIIGVIIVGICFNLIPLSNKFSTTLIIWSVLGLGSTLTSGAEVAWVIDNLKFNKRKKLEKEYFIKYQSILYAGFVIAPLIGSFIVKNLSMDLLWYVIGISHILGAIIFIIIPEHFKPAKTTVKKALKNNFKTAKKGFKHIKKKRNLFLVIFASAFSAIAFMAEDGWTPLMVDVVKFPIESIGYFISGLSAALIFIPFLASKIKNEKKALIMTTSLQLILLLGTLFIKEGRIILAASIFLIPEMVRGLKRPILEHYIQKMIPTKIRATTSSIENMVIMGINTIVVVIAGALMDVFPIQYVIGGSSIFFIGSIICFSKLEIKKKRKLEIKKKRKINQTVF